MESVPESGSLLFDVWVLANRAHAVLDEALRSSGLTANEFAIYNVLRGPDGRTPTELAYVMQLPPTTVSSVIRRLEQRDHVRREADPDDGRSYRVHLTREGVAALTKAQKLFRPVLAQVEADLGMPVDRARDVLDQIDRALRPSP